MTNPIPSKKCKVCKQSFQKKYYEGKPYWATKKYCSKECSLKKTSLGLMTTKQRREINLGKIPWNKGVKYGPEMRARLDLSGLAIGHGYNKGKKFPENSGRKNPNWKPKVKVTCVYCGKTNRFEPYRAKRSKRLFCNPLCYSTWHRGKNSPVYAGPHSLGNQYKRFRAKLMELPEYKNWRTKVFTRDGFTCVLCGKHGTLHADHIEKFVELIRRLKVKTIEQARNNKAVWRVANGRTLCIGCHRKTDTYGKQTLPMK